MNSLHGLFKARILHGPVYGYRPRGRVEMQRSLPVRAAEGANTLSRPGEAHYWIRWLSALMLAQVVQVERTQCLTELVVPFEFCDQLAEQRRHGVHPGLSCRWASGLGLRTRNCLHQLPQVADIPPLPGELHCPFPQLVRVQPLQVLTHDLPLPDLGAFRALRDRLPRIATGGDGAGQKKRQRDRLLDL